MNPLTIRPERLARLRSICLALPGTVEKEAWGDPTWRVGDRIFAMQKGNVEGRRPSLWVKAEPGVQEMVVAAAPDRYFVPPYVGSKGWIGLWLDRRSVDWKELAALVAESWRCMAPKRLLRATDDVAPAPPPRARQPRARRPGARRGKL